MVEYRQTWYHIDIISTVKLSNQLVKLILHTESIPKICSLDLMTHTEKMADFSQHWPISDRFRARSCSNDLFNDVLTVGLILECINNKGKLNQKAESRRSFEPKQILFWVKADDPKKCVFLLKEDDLGQSRRSYFAYFYIPKQTIIVRI